MSETELSVVCKNCGSEVSPYVTECPYCGARLRKRAPKLQRRGDALEAKQRRRHRRRPRLRRPRVELESGLPYATLAVILASVCLLLAERVSGESLTTLGALVVPLESDWWRYLAAPFVYTDVGYLFVVGLAVALFGPGLERRLGSVATALLLVACGSLGMVAAYAIEDTGDSLVLIAGGNGLALGAIAAWLMLRRAEARSAIDEDYDKVGVAVAAVVVLALPIFDDVANLFAGVVGGAIGLLAGLAAAAFRPAE
jgi:membrane associated rhomboid family serine protease